MDEQWGLTFLCKEAKQQNTLSEGHDPANESVLFCSPRFLPRSDVYWENMRNKANIQLYDLLALVKNNVGQRQ